MKPIEDIVDEVSRRDVVSCRLESGQEVVGECARVERDDGITVVLSPVDASSRPHRIHGDPFEDGEEVVCLDRWDPDEASWEERGRVVDVTVGV